MKNIIKTESINSEEAAKIRTYFRELLEEGLENLKDNGGNILKQIELCNKLVDVIATETNADFIKKFMIDEKAELLIAYLQKRNNIHAINENIRIVRPATSIARSSLFTGAIHEPSMFSELKRDYKL